MTIIATAAAAAAPGRQRFSHPSRLLEALVKKNVVVTAAAALLTAIAASPAVAQSTEGILLNPAKARAKLQQAPAGQTTQAPKTAPYVTPGARFNLTLEDAVARARERNIDIGVAR